MSPSKFSSVPHIKPKIQCNSIPTSSSDLLVNAWSIVISLYLLSTLGSFKNNSICLIWNESLSGSFSGNNSINSLILLTSNFLFNNSSEISISLSTNLCIKACLNPPNKLDVPHFLSCERTNFAE